MTKKRKHWLRSDEVERLFVTIRSHSERDFVIFTLCRWGLRIGEIVGHNTETSLTIYERWKDPSNKALGKEQISTFCDLPGIYVRDLRDNGIEITGKGWKKGNNFQAGYIGPQLVPFPAPVMALVRDYCTGMRPNQKIFAVSVRQMERRLLVYAKESDIEEWKRVSPHRLRAFFATDAKDKGLSAYQIMDLMRHKNLTTTNIYVGPSTPEQILKIMETLV